MKVIKSSGLNPAQNIYFDWHLTNWCNFKCSYCPVLDVITNDFTKDDHAQEYKLVLARLSKVQTSFNVCITGGEPTLNPELIDILKGLVAFPNCQDVSIFTNLSRPLPFYDKIKSIGSKKIMLFASFHPEFSDVKFVQRCIALSRMTDLRFAVHLTMSDKEEHWGKTLSLLDTLIKHNVNHKPLLLSPTNNYTPNYTDKFFDTFKRYLDRVEDEHFFLTIPIEYVDGTTENMKSYDVEIQGLNKFKGYQCTPISYNISIDGVITNTCTSRKVPLILSDANLLVKETCPKDTCPGRRLLESYKEIK